MKTRAPIPPELFALRREGHKHFDRLWKSRLMSRQTAYEKLATEMGLTREQAHFSLFDEEQCRRAIALMEKWKRIVVEWKEERQRSRAHRRGRFDRKGNIERQAFIRETRLREREGDD